MEVASNAVYPDRVLTIGSYLMLGNEETLDEMPYEQRRNPKLLREARSVKSQSTIFELGWEQKSVQPGFKSEHLVVECQV